MQTGFLDVARQRRRFFGHGKKRQPEIGLHSQASIGDLWTRIEGMDKQRWIVVLHVAFLYCHAMLLVMQCSPRQERCMMRKKLLR